jgi:hypothetical protein
MKKMTAEEAKLKRKEYHAEWHAKNKDKISEKRKSLRLANPDKLKLQGKMQRERMTDEQKARKKELAKESYIRVKERDKDAFNARMLENQNRYALNNPDKIKESRAKHYEANKEIIAARKKAYRLANIDHVKELNKASRERHKAKRNAASREWNKSNAEKVKENMAIWKRDNKDKAQVHDQNKRARKRYNVGSKRLSSGLAKQLYIDQKGQCKYCKTEFIDNNYHIDHIMPWL